jgi:pimeloyl-ACP methyl ester carboxylesterase
MGAGPRIHGYGDGEAMLGFGPADGPQLLVLQPLFEEMNRTRALIGAICRGLAERGIGCWLPDLPGTGESPRALDTLSWRNWRDAVPVIVAATGVRISGSVAFRGGALLDDGVEGGHWRLAPTMGRSLLSDLRRSALASGSDPATPAGYTISPDLAGPLAAADVAQDDRTRTVRLVSDDRPANLHVEGIPVWRRPEPQQDNPLAALLVDDIALWAKA